jgi:hypothetical protein
MKHNDLAAWHLDLTAPSIFTTGSREGRAQFVALATTPLTRGQVASQAVHRKEQREGRNPGTITGLSVAADSQIRARKGRAA